MVTDTIVYSLVFINHVFTGTLQGFSVAKNWKLDEEN